MCTVSLALNVGRCADGFRLVSNRDELRTRARARPPVEHDGVHATMLMPIDPQGGGTWIGVNNRGVVAVLLNSNTTGGVATDRVAGRESRGVVVPRVLDTPDFEAACEVADGLDARAFAPFRLFMLHCGSWVHWHGTGDVLRRVASSAMDRPVCFASSGLGDALVQQPRRDLFHAMIQASGGYDSATQDRFHHTPMPDAPELGVMMSRADARTVSVTAVTVEPAAARGVMVYQPLDQLGREPQPAVTVALPLRQEATG